MELNFDIRGNLKPYEVIKVTKEIFRAHFVDSFVDEEIRLELFLKYERYMSDLALLLSQDFYQWVDGSFVTNKRKPNDIDIVTIISHIDFEANKKLLEQNYTSLGARLNYNVDAYIIINYPKNHKKAFFTTSDLLYWRNLFGKTKVNRAKKQFEKGIIPLNFNQNG